jgi:hypothetical protein
MTLNVGNGTLLLLLLQALASGASSSVPARIGGVQSENQPKLVPEIAHIATITSLLALPCRILTISKDLRDADVLVNLKQCGAPPRGQVCSITQYGQMSSPQF